MFLFFAWVRNCQGVKSGQQKSHPTRAIWSFEFIQIPLPPSMFFTWEIPESRILGWTRKTFSHMNGSIDKKVVKECLKFCRKILERPMLGYKPTTQLFLAPMAMACCFPRWLWMRQGNVVGHSSLPQVQYSCQLVHAACEAHSCPCLDRGLWASFSLRLGRMCSLLCSSTWVDD